MDEVLLIDKPVGITSYDCIRQLKKKYPRGTKIGHAGTLDPLASGLMIIGIGSATKKLHEYLKLPKTYEAEILLGKKTTTGDLEGEIVEEKSVGPIKESDLEKVLKSMQKEHVLSVSVYSAIKDRGVPLYKRARKGEHVVPPKKKMIIHSIKLLDNTKDVLRVQLDVSSGTYVRSIAEEVGKRLGYPATLKSLRRTKIGDFEIENAQSVVSPPGLEPGSRG